MPVARFTPFVALLLAAAWSWPTHGDDRAVAFDEAILKEAGIAPDGPALLEFFRKRTLTDAEQAKIADQVRQLGNISFAVREQTTTDLIALGRVARAYLKPALTDRDPEIVRRAERCLAAIEGNAGTALPVAAARLLAVRKPDDAAAVILNYLPLADDELLEEELLKALALVGVHDGKPDAALAAALKDAKPTRRAAAALVIGRLTAAEERAAVRPLLADADATVRLRAAEGLVCGKEKEAIPALIALLSDAPLSAAWPAEELLCRIAGEKSPQIWLRAGSDAERRQCRAAWDAWWRDHEKTLDLTKLDLDQRTLGLTLICACDGYNQGRGRVWEVGADGKARWEINLVNYPVDAQVLSGQRVLIAEQSGRKVTERDFQGKVLWQHPVTDSLVACQRLSNGNTFVATYGQVYEVAPGGKTAYTHRGTQGSIYAAQKLRNGHIAYLGSNGTFVELDDSGKEVRTLAVTPAPVGLIKFDVLPGGQILLGRQDKVVELDNAGKVVWECPIANANSVLRLPNGNTLASCYPDRRVVEVDRSGKVVWEQRADGGPLRIQRR